MSLWIDVSEFIKWVFSATPWIAISEFLRNIGLGLAGFGGLILAWRKLSPELKQAGAAATKVGLDRRGHVYELFNRAVGQLSDERLEVRLGAVYVLRELGWDFPDLANPIFELVSAHLREKTHDYGDAEPPIDVQEMMSMLVTRISADV
jgi:hypothetical protein